MKNAENVLEIYVIRSEDYTLFEMELTLWVHRDEMATRDGSIKHIFFVTDGYDHKVTLLKINLL